MPRAWIVIGVISAAACAGDDPAYVAGDYSLSLTNRDNDCDFQNWTEGDTATGVPMTLVQTQGDSHVTGTVNGAAGLWLDLVLGTREFEGEVDGRHLRLNLHGTNSATMDGCTYTVNAILDGSSSGDVLTGRINYIPATNGSPDCGVLNDCISWQEFNGTRPPTN